jgi:hypothetical protein
LRAPCRRSVATAPPRTSLPSSPSGPLAVVGVVAGRARLSNRSPRRHRPAAPRRSLLPPPQYSAASVKSVSIFEFHVESPPSLSLGRLRTLPCQTNQLYRAASTARLLAGGMLCAPLPLPSTSPGAHSAPLSPRAPLRVLLAAAPGAAARHRPVAPAAPQQHGQQAQRVAGQCAEDAGDGPHLWSSPTPGHLDPSVSLPKQSPSCNQMKPNEAKRNRI